MSGGVLGTGLAFPLGVDRRGGVALAVGEDDVEQAIRIILATAPGERPMRPEFGCAIHSYVFDVVDAETLGRLELEVRAAMERWEPRIDVQSVAFETSAVDDGWLEVQLRYRVRATSSVRNLVYPFYVIPAEEGA
jgi:phage baseplate assembly protein W